MWHTEESLDHPGGSVVTDYAYVATSTGFGELEVGAVQYVRHCSEDRRNNFLNYLIRVQKNYFLKNPFRR